MSTAAAFGLGFAACVALIAAVVGGLVWLIKWATTPNNTGGPK